MNPQRRDVLKAGSGLGLLGLLAAAGLILPGAARADGPRRAFDAGTLAEALEALGAVRAANSRDIRITGPEVAENGAAVPLGISASLPGAERLAILVEKNLNPLVASFILPEGTEAHVQTRVRMAQTSDVIALVKAEGGFYMAAREIRVTIGGCSG